MKWLILTFALAAQTPVTTLEVNLKPPFYGAPNAPATYEHIRSCVEKSQTHTCKIKITPGTYVLNWGAPRFSPGIVSVDFTGSTLIPCDGANFAVVAAHETEIIGLVVKTDKPCGAFVLNKWFQNVYREP